MIGTIYNIMDVLKENGSVKTVVELSTGNMMVEMDFNGIIFKKEFNNEPDTEEFEDAKEMIENAWSKFTETREGLLVIKDCLDNVRNINASYNTYKNIYRKLDDFACRVYDYDIMVLRRAILTLMINLSTPMVEDEEFAADMNHRILKAHSDVKKASKFIE